MLKKERADFILTRLNELYPETPVPLDHKNNFTLLVAVLLSAQCTDERVNKVTPSLQGTRTACRMRTKLGHGALRGSPWPASHPMDAQHRG